VDAQRDVLIGFFGAFAGFSAFGAVIATFLATSNALPWLGAFWGGHGLAEAEEEGRGSTVGFWTRNRRVILIWTATGGIGLAALVSCLGLIISFFWLHASTAANDASMGWQYEWTGVLLLIEVVLITLITLLVTISAALYAVKQGTKTIELYRQMQQQALSDAAATITGDVTMQPAEPHAGPVP
jgi:uncharacterized membrane protein